VVGESGIYERKDLDVLYAVYSCRPKNLGTVVGWVGWMQGRVGRGVIGEERRSRTGSYRVATKQLIDVFCSFVRPSCFSKALFVSFFGRRCADRGKRGGQDIGQHAQVAHTTPI